MSPDIDLDIARWVAELRAAGWRDNGPSQWKAPCGCVHVGPYRAYCVLQASKETGMSCPRHELV